MAYIYIMQQWGAYIVPLLDWEIFLSNQIIYIQWKKTKTQKKKRKEKGSEIIIMKQRAMTKT